MVRGRVLFAAVVTGVIVAAIPASNASAATAPGAVQDVQLVAGNGYLTASWSPPASDGGSPVFAYSVVAVRPQGDVAAWTNLRADATSASVAGLTNGLTYTVYVVAWNADGRSAASTTGSPSAAGPTSTPPPRPRGLQVTFADRGFHGVTARWVAPSSDGGAPIVAYSMVTQYGKPPHLVTRWTHVDPHTREAVCADCDANVVSVFAWNANGPGQVAAFGMFPP